jgi:hypothetical protein
VAADPQRIALRYRKEAGKDLSPPLGHPGGSCYFQRRIRENVTNKRVQDYLIEKHQDEEKWQDIEEESVYRARNIGPIGKTFVKVELVPHAQRRMDLRSLTVDEVTKGLRNFLGEMAKQKTRGDTALQKKLLSRKDFYWKGHKTAFWIKGMRHWTETVKGKEILKVNIEVRTAMPVPFKHPAPIEESECPHFKGEDWEGWSKEYPEHGFGRLFPKRVASRYAVLRQDPTPGVQTYVSQKSEEGLPTGIEKPVLLPLPGSATPGGEGRLISQFSFSGPDSGSDIKPRTLGIPGEQYGHPSNDTYNTVTRRIIESALDDDEETMEKQAYQRRWRPGKYQRKSRGRKKHKRQMNYRRNRAKNKLRAKRWRKINSKKPAYKQWQKRRRSMNRKRRVASSLRVAHAYRTGSVLTVPDISFLIGPDMLGGYVRSISPMSGMVTFELSETNVSQLDSMPVELFLRMAVFATDDDIDAFFDLVDVEIGPEAYEDLDESLVRECARRYNRDPDSDSFKEDCFGVSGEYDLSEMDADQRNAVVQMVARGYMQSGEAHDFTTSLDADERSEDDADNPEISDLYDPEMYYGEVELVQ